MPKMTVTQGKWVEPFDGLYPSLSMKRFTREREFKNRERGESERQNEQWGSPHE